MIVARFCARPGSEEGRAMSGISTGTVLASGAALCLGAALAISTPKPPADLTKGEEPPAAPGADKFVPVDTSRLMGSPDAQPTLGVERAFPQVQFVRPVDFTHAGDGTNRVFVVEQD